mmetsp:Transcript_10405/g.25162  ORF Transcript_10405/g.25162 Transcript_10405/m.25162 type:complete len:171 (-) Transcript_10405:155-667(-)
MGLQQDSALRLVWGKDDVVKLQTLHDVLDGGEAPMQRGDEALTVQEVTNLLVAGHIPVHAHIVVVDLPPTRGRLQVLDKRSGQSHNCMSANSTVALRSLGGILTPPPPPSAPSLLPVWKRRRTSAEGLWTVVPLVSSMAMIWWARRARRALCARRREVAVGGRRRPMSME